MTFYKIPGPAEARRHLQNPPWLATPEKYDVIEENISNAKKNIRNIEKKATMELSHIRNQRHPIPISIDAIYCRRRRTPTGPNSVTNAYMYVFET